MADRNDHQVLDDLLDALGNARRRHVLYHVREHGEDDVATLTATVVDRLEARSGEGRGNENTRSQVRTVLHHVDLPKLTDVGLIAVDQRTETVSFEGNDFHEALLDVLSEHDQVQEARSVDGDSIYRGL